MIVPFNTENIVSKFVEFKPNREQWSRKNRRKGICTKAMLLHKLI